MMKAAQLFHWFGRHLIEREIEEELAFHLELLTEQHLQRDMSLAEANEAALIRFGDIEHVKKQCVEISRNCRPLTRALKSSPILLFLIGILVRVFTNGFEVHHLGDILILVAFSGRLFFYVRGLNPSRFTSEDELLSPLMLNENRLTPFTAYDQRRRSPLKRAISDS